MYSSWQDGEGGKRRRRDKESESRSADKRGGKRQSRGARASRGEEARDACSEECKESQEFGPAIRVNPIRSERTRMARESETHMERR